MIRTGAVNTTWNKTDNTTNNLNDTSWCNTSNTTNITLNDTEQATTTSTIITTLNDTTWCSNTTSTLNYTARATSTYATQNDTTNQPGISEAEVMTAQGDSSVKGKK